MAEKDRTKVHRSPHKQTNDPLIARQLLARAIVAHVAIVDAGQPICLPVACAPFGDELLLHGSAASRLFKVLASGISACVTITNIQALVLARSAFDSSMHYQSLMAFGSARIIVGDEKSVALNALTEHLFPERRQRLRNSTTKELLATSVLAFPLTEISVKVSDNFPEAPEGEHDAGLWIGVLPIVSEYGVPVPIDSLNPDVEIPQYISRWPINRI